MTPLNISKENLAFIIDFKRIHNLKTIDETISKLIEIVKGVYSNLK